MFKFPKQMVTAYLLNQNVLDELLLWMLEMYNEYQTKSEKEEKVTCELDGPTKITQASLKQLVCFICHVDGNINISRRFCQRGLLDHIKMVHSS